MMLHNISSGSCVVELNQRVILIPVHNTIIPGKLLWDNQ